MARRVYGSREFQSQRNDLRFQGVRFSIEPMAAAVLNFRQDRRGGRVPSMGALVLDLYLFMPRLNVVPPVYRSHKAINHVARKEKGRAGGKWGRDILVPIAHSLHKYKSTQGRNEGGNHKRKTKTTQLLLLPAYPRAARVGSSASYS